MGREEQTEEREILDSIFPEEITDVNENEYRVAIQLDVTNDEGDDTPAPILLLSVQYPENYPDEAPRLDITNPPNAPKHKYLDVQHDKTSLLADLGPTIEENLGMVMVFTLVTTLKDSAELLVSQRQRAIEAEKEKEAAAAEAEENRKFEGTKVTKEVFEKWLREFKEEQAEEKRKIEEQREVDEKKKRGPKEERKLTGRELWEKGLAGNSVDEDDEGVDSLAGMSSLKIEG